MKVEIKNDGKMKYNSWEARAEVQLSVTDCSFVSADLVAWGADEAEARVKLHEAAARLADELTAPPPDVEA